jgi:hypothetical protein
VDNLWLDRGEHACHFHESFTEQKRVVLSFFREGLANGEHCLYITSDQSDDEWYFEFQAYGIDVQRERQRGALQIVHRSDWRPAGEFNSMVQARRAIDLFDRLLVEFRGIRIVGDAAWALEPELAVDQLCHWEATANLVYKGQDIRAICQYNLKDHSAAAIHSALRTHPVIILDGRRCPNPYYEAPRILENEPHLNHSNADELAVDDMLARLRAGPGRHPKR